jgi:hypothetical protein
VRKIWHILNPFQQICRNTKLSKNNLAVLVVEKSKAKGPHPALSKGEGKKNFLNLPLWGRFKGGLNAFCLTIFNRPSPLKKYYN